MLNWRSPLLLPLLASLACSGSSSDPSDGGDDGSDGMVDPVDDGCPSLFAQDVVPDFHVEISESDWAALEYEFVHRDERIAAGEDPTPYHPIVFRHDGEVVEDAMIRLNGASSWTEALLFEDDPFKMQFVISFNENNEDGRYRGRRKIALDMPRSDWTFLRHRLGLYALRSIGVPAQCANNARLFVNGDYYGLYSNIERMDRELLERLFPEAPDGNLWKGGRIIKTNEDDFTWERLTAFWEVGESGTVAQLAAMSDLPASIEVWAAEAVLPHPDGYYAGRANFYLYDHPERGFLWLPEDLDSAFDFVAPTVDALFPPCIGQHPEDRQHYLLVMDDPTWRQRYIDALGRKLHAYDPADMEMRLDQWSAQIAEAADADPHKPFSMGDHETAVEDLRGFFRQRAGFLAEWLDCLTSGGPDSDGDGAEMCRDCDDSSRDFGPQVTETCNQFDDDCDGHIDEVADCPAGG
ncbi:MAG TPA: CotH kinase family protein [Kofleriaceae bacterium]|nr:CotH kinase family protein [Kofleriaceae bacterium]